MLFKNKVVVITGGGSGIGKVSAIKFAEEGAKVVVSDVNENDGEAVVASIQASGGIASFVKADVSKYEEVEHLIQTTIDTFGGLDIGLNNAGIGGNITLKTADADVSDFDRVMAVNTSGVFYCMKLQLQHMQQQKSGAIVNIASIAGLRGLPNNLAYVASKHAVVGMTKTAAMEYAKHGIRINAVCPAFTKTQLFNPELYEQFAPGIADKLMKTIPMRRFGEASEIADAILWICSERSSFVTGLALPVDGGLTA